MGVREACQEGGELNIHDLIIESETKREALFDANVDILPKEWKKMQDWFEAASCGTSDPFIEIGPFVKQIFPEKDALPALSRAKYRQKPLFSDTLGSAEEYEIEIVNAQHDLAVKILFPSTAEQNHLDTNDNWTTLAGFLYGECMFRILKFSPWHVERFNLKTLCCAKMAYPKRIGTLQLEALRTNVSSYIIATAEKAHQAGNWQEYADCLGTMKMLYPEQMRDYKIDETAWQGMRGALDTALCGREFPDCRAVASLIYNMQVLAAKEVVFDEKGMHLVMPERHDFQKSQPDLPIRKQF